MLPNKAAAQMASSELHDYNLSRYKKFNRTIINVYKCKNILAPTFKYLCIDIGHKMFNNNYMIHYFATI